MPAFGPDADALVQALAEADGELVAEADPPASRPTTRRSARCTARGWPGSRGTRAPRATSGTAGSSASPDPVATGPDLTRTAGRIRRDWFDRFLENPLRYYPGTPMPSIFPHGQPATLPRSSTATRRSRRTPSGPTSRWARTPRARSRRRRCRSTAPAAGEGPILVAQIPIRLPDGKVVESLCLLSARHDLLVYDLGEGSPHTLFTGGQILRNVQGRIRQFLAAGDRRSTVGPAALRLVVNDKPRGAGRAHAPRLRPPGGRGPRPLEAPLPGRDRRGRGHAAAAGDAASSSARCGRPTCRPGPSLEVRPMPRTDGPIRRWSRRPTRPARPR